ncbi:hypothetical protein ACORG1_00805 [Mycobacterium sp. TJFP1]
MAEADFTRAEDYGRITVQEATEAYELYASWLTEMPQILAAKGVDEEAVQHAMATAEQAIGCHDLDSGWSQYRCLIEEFAAECRRGDAISAGEILLLARATWQHHHDRACDSICAMFDLAAGTLGEASVGELWDKLLAGMYDRAAELYNPEQRPWQQSVERLLLDIFEATRGHLTGPRRDGEFSVVEEQTRWVITFAPCGSGGRSYESRDVDDAWTAANERPNSFTTDRHDWAWNSTGVCLYCVHCCQLQQRAPIARLGFPLRVVDPPRRGQSQTVCTWSIYKNPRDVPAEAYTSVGYEPPAR